MFDLFFFSGDIIFNQSLRLIYSSFSNISFIRNHHLKSIFGWFKKRLRKENLNTRFEQFAKFSEIRLILRPGTQNVIARRRWKVPKKRGRRKEIDTSPEGSDQCSLYSSCCKNFHRTAVSRSKVGRGETRTSCGI